MGKFLNRLNEFVTFILIFIQTNYLIEIIKSELRLIIKRLYLPKWPNRLIFYLLIFASITLLSYIIFPFLGLLNNDIDSSLYMLSALVQSEAAIIAIVISLNLLAVQLSSQTYSTRFIEIYRRTPDLWILIYIYLIAIIFGLGVLKLIETGENEISNLSYIGSFITFTYIFRIFTFASLVIYISYIFQLLKPLTMINLLSEEITEKSIIRINSEQDRKNSGENDQIQHIFDILRGSMEKNDFKTLKDGFILIDRQINLLINSPPLYLDNQTYSKYIEKFLNNIIWHFAGVGRIAINRDDEDSTIEVIKYLNKNGEIAINKEYENVAENAIRTIGVFGKRASEKKLENATGWALNSLENLGTSLIDKSFVNLVKITVEYIGEIGKEACEQKQKIAIKIATESLGNIGVKAVENNLKDVTIHTTMELEDIGKNVVHQNFEYVSEEVVKSLGKMGKEAAGRRLRYSLNIVESLTEIGILAAKESLKKTTMIAVESLGDVVEEALKKKELEDVINNVIKSFEKLGLIAIEKLKLYDEIWTIAIKLGYIGIETTEQNLDNTTERILESLEIIGKATIEFNFGDTLQFLIQIRDVGLVADGETKNKARESLSNIKKAAKDNGIDDIVEKASVFLNEISN